MKLRKRKSTLYLSPQESPGRRGGECRGGRSVAEAAESERGLHLLDRVAKNRSALETGFSIPAASTTLYFALFDAVLPATW